MGKIRTITKGGLHRHSVRIDTTCESSAGSLQQYRSKFLYSGMPEFDDTCSRSYKIPVSLTNYLKKIMLQFEDVDRKMPIDIYLANIIYYHIEENHHVFAELLRFNRK